jgi:signal transduction histidine kinase
MTANGKRVRLSFQTKVLIPVLAFLVLVPAIMVGIVNSRISGQLLRETQRSVATANGVFRQAIESRSRDLLERMRSALNESRYRSFAQVAANGQSAAADATIRVFLSERLQDFGDDCQVIFFSYEGGTKPVGYLRRSSFDMGDFAKAASAVTGIAVKGEAYTNILSFNGAVFRVGSVPVTSPDNEQYVGVLTIGVRIAESAVQELGKLTHTEILLLANDHVVVSSFSVPSEDLAQEIERASHGADSHGDGDRSHTDSLVINGEHFLALSDVYNEGDASRGVSYVLLSSYEASLQALEDTQRTLVAVAIAGMLLSGATIWYFVRRGTRPLRELRDSAEAVGRGDFSRRIQKFSNDECGDLADAFNRMTGSLQGSRAELEKAVETLKATQAQLIQSEKLSAVGQFVAGVAHELNNPLTAVIGFSDLLNMTTEDESVRPHLEMIAKSAHRCHKIVQNLLGFARQHAPERKLIEISKTIEVVLEIMAYDLRTSNIEVVRDFQKDLPPILGDSHQLQQVFVNILGNARQAMQGFRPDGTITIRVREDRGKVAIEFEDDGPGISAANLSRIFDPFFTTKPVGKGTGLGLSLSYGIIQEHQGRINVTSAPGHGAVFRIELPVTRSESNQVPGGDESASSELRTSAARGTSILLVDDEEWILVLGKKLLQADGHSVQTASSGEEAVAAMRRQKFDGIVCDWKMPGMNGIQFYEHLLATNSAMAKRVLFMSGDVINDNFQEFLRRNSRRCISKPFPVSEFQDAVVGLVAG